MDLLAYLYSKEDHAPHPELEKFVQMLIVSRDILLLKIISNLS